MVLGFNECEDDKRVGKSGVGVIGKIEYWIDVLRGPQYWKENQQDIEVQNRDTDIIKYVCKDYGEYVV